MTKKLWQWSDGSASLWVERLVLGEIGIRTEGGGVILDDDAIVGLTLTLLAEYRTAPEAHVVTIVDREHGARSNYDLSCQCGWERMVAGSERAAHAAAAGHEQAYQPAGGIDPFAGLS